MGFEQEALIHTGQIHVQEKRRTCDIHWISRVKHCLLDKYNAVISEFEV